MSIDQDSKRFSLAAGALADSLWEDAKAYPPKHLDDPGFVRVSWGDLLALASRSMVKGAELASERPLTSDQTSERD